MSTTSGPAGALKESRPTDTHEGEEGEEGRPTDTYEGLAPLGPRTIARSLLGADSDPLMGEAMPHDNDDRATYVLVFTRAAAVESRSVDLGKLVSNPRESAAQIFKQARDQEIEGLGDDPLSAREYHRIVRQKIKAVLLRSGFTCTCFSSLDGDETFLKLYLDRDGDRVRALAQRFEYSVPLSETCYESTKRITNAEGSQCFAYIPFTADLHERGRLQRLRPVDVIRIAHRHLSGLIDLEQLREQKFISTHFAVAGSGERKDLRAHWRHPLRFHSVLVPLQVRDYFGEQVGFFFHFFAFFVRAIFVLGVICFCIWCLEWLIDDRFGPNRWRSSYCRIALGVAIASWAILFEVCLTRSSTRTAQVWGMSVKTEKLIQRNLETFKEELVGRSDYKAEFCTVLYCALFMIGVAAMRMYSSVDMRLPRQVTLYAIAFIVAFAKFMWGKVAHRITQWENHKTQERFNDALFLRLAIFKTFFMLWPLMCICSVDKITMAYCGSSFTAAVEKAYGPLSQQGQDDGRVQWPPREEGAHVLNETNFAETLKLYELTPFEVAVRHMSWKRLLSEEKGEACLSYCLPSSDCHQISEDDLALDCATNCHENLDDMVLAQYITHLVVTFAFTLFPLIEVRHEVAKEVSAVESEGSGGPSCCCCPASPSHVHYTALQVQAKKMVCAKYEYLSWGGSYVEDTLELLLGFAYVSFFGLVNPLMVMIASVALAVEYRLLQWRMLFVTGRPYPEVALNIGSCKLMLVNIGTIGVFINAYLLAFVMGPARSRAFSTKLIIFLCFGTGSLLLRTLLRNMLFREPSDVRIIDDHNDDVLRRLRTGGCVESDSDFSTHPTPRGEPSSRIDIGL